MRLLVVGVCLVLSTTGARAQSRWTFSAGPEWGLVAPQTHLWGLRLRAEYDLTKPNSIFGLRFEGAARWSPTQSYFYSENLATWSGTEQRNDLMFGLSTSLSPLAHASPIAPYVTFGVYARQLWQNGSSSFAFQGSPVWGSPPGTRARGDIIATLGVGLRARVAGRMFQVELRGIHDQYGLTFGSRLPF